MRATLAIVSVMVFLVAGAPLAAADELFLDDPSWYPSWYPSWGPRLLGAQFTLVGQSLLPLHSPYSGPNSLTGQGDGVLSETDGLYLGAQIKLRAAGGPGGSRAAER